MSFSGLLFCFSLYFKWKVPPQKNRNLNSGFPVVWGVGGRTHRDPPHYPENWLDPHMSPSLSSPKNDNFVILLQFLGILPKLSLPTSQPYLERLGNSIYA